MIPMAASRPTVGSARPAGFPLILTLDTNGAPDASFKGQALVDYVTTQKLSTYGYAIETEHARAAIGPDSMRV